MRRRRAQYAPPPLRLARPLRQGCSAGAERARGQSVRRNESAHTLPRLRASQRRGSAARFFALNNLAATTAALVRLGAFDGGFSIASEDRDLCARWRESGRELVYAPEALVAHAHHLTLRRFWTQHFRYGRGAWRYHATLRQRGHGRFARDLGFHAHFLSRAGPPLKQRGNAAPLAILLVVWQVADLAGFIFEAIASRLPSRGPAAKIS